MEKSRIYYCIDMKCFFASVECAERGLDPFTTPLVVADEARGSAALCLAVSPLMKRLGVKNRCRLFEIPKSIDYQIAKPRMQKYIDYAADIYEIYLRYISPGDIHVYSIDEAFIDATDYLKCYKKEPKEFARFLVSEIAREKKIPATVGVGTNLYLAKVALDITAKKSPDHMAMLTEESYRKTLWEHQPLTDFWQISSGTVKRLSRYAIFDMRGIAKAPEEMLYRLFGVNAELLIDHAWGRESCTIADIKQYRSKSHSMSSSQILFSDYSFDKAAIVLSEMVRNGCQEMMRRRVITSKIALYVGYSKDVLPAAKASVRMTATTQVYSVILPYVMGLFEKITDKKVPIRRLGITFCDIVSDGWEGYDLFTDIEAVEREKTLEHTVLDIKDKYGKNAMLRLSDLQEGATARERNKLIGGHNRE
ncbi:MAG: DNA repair protein [Clostridia bacterium]|nr:DNA repair protein [Clostridia bacterium]